MLHLVARREMVNLSHNIEGARDLFSQLQHSMGLFRANVEDLLISCRCQRRTRNNRRNIINVREGSGLQPIAENRHRLSMQHLVHEDTNDIAVSICDVLALAIDIMGAKNDVGQTKHSISGL